MDFKLHLFTIQKADASNMVDISKLWIALAQFRLVAYSLTLLSFSYSEGKFAS